MANYRNMPTPAIGDALGKLDKHVRGCDECMADRHSFYTADESFKLCGTGSRQYVKLQAARRGAAKKG